MPTDRQIAELKLTKFKSLLEVVDGSISRDEFVDNFKIVVALIKEFKKDTTKDLEQFYKDVQLAMKMLKSETFSLMDEVKKKSSEHKKILEGDLKDLIRKQESDLEDILFKITALENVKPLDKEELTNKILSLVPKVSLEELEEKLEGRFDELKKLIEEKQRPSGNIYGAGKTKVLIKDLSSELDGVTKTFSIGTHFGITGVWGSSTPFPFRPTIDYTESGKNIVFTSGIDASLSLAAGQTLLVQYVK